MARQATGLPQLDPAPAPPEDPTFHEFASQWFESRRGEISPIPVELFPHSLRRTFSSLLTYAARTSFTSCSKWAIPTRSSRHVSTRRSSGTSAGAGRGRGSCGVLDGVRWTEVGPTSGLDDASRHRAGLHASVVSVGGR